ncbi:MAG: FRG domain-containing protein [Phycisphaerales bacterium]|nr:FRG domain-containing protein [Phycisphaerales bacterium]
MDELKVTSAKELEACLAHRTDRYLYRGQTRHHIDNSNNVSIPTSFSRHGCIPPLMFKWAHYAKAILWAYGRLDYHNIDVELPQAILQHYGWRSFYIDVTKSPHVAGWFAANKYTDTKQIHMCETYDTMPVWLVHRIAGYTASTEPGHIYVIDRTALADNGLKIHDLADLRTDDATLRFHAQEACLVGSLKNALPPVAISAHLEVTHDALVEFYQRHSVAETADLFPTRGRDFILDALLSIPWQCVSKFDTIPVYCRGLDLPEYDAHFVKHLSPDIALWDEFWVSDNRGKADSVFHNIPFYKIPEQAYYANANDAFELSAINDLLTTHNSFVVELDGVVRIPELGTDAEYEKGIFVEHIEHGLVSVSGLVIELRGHVVAGAGVLRGWYYGIENGIWKRVKHVEQCSCNNTLRHELQFALLRVLNESLKAGQMERDSERSYSHKELRMAQQHKRHGTRGARVGLHRRAEQPSSGRYEDRLRVTRGCGDRDDRGEQDVAAYSDRFGRHDYELAGFFACPV